MWKKFAATHKSRDTAHAQWLQTHCQWYPMGDVRTYKSRTDSRRIFKLGGGIDQRLCILYRTLRRYINTVIIIIIIM